MALKFIGGLAGRGNVQESQRDSNPSAQRLPRKHSGLPWETVSTNSSTLKALHPIRRRAAATGVVFILPVHPAQASRASGSDRQGWAECCNSVGVKNGHRTRRPHATIPTVPRSHRVAVGACPWQSPAAAHPNTPWPRNFRHLTVVFALRQVLRSRAPSQGVYSPSIF